MTGERELATSSERETVHRGEDRFLTALQATKHRRSLARQGFGLEDTARRKLADVGPRHERLGTGSGDDRRADRTVILETTGHVSQLVDDGVIQGVELLRPVDRDRRDAVGELEEQRGVAHGTWRESGGAKISPPESLTSLTPDP